MHPADELKKISSLLKKHLDEEEELPPWEEVLEPSVTTYYQQKGNTKVPKETKNKPENKPSSEIKTTIKTVVKKELQQEIKNSDDLPNQKEIRNKPLSPLETPAEKISTPQPKVNHELFKGLCQELFPDLKFVKPSQLNQPEVVIFSPLEAKEEIQLFLQKIGDAIKNKGIETLITGELSAIHPLMHLNLILVERRWMAELPDTTATILPLDEIETLITHSEKKKLLWQQIRNTLKI